MNYVDVLVTLTSLVEVAFVALVLPMNPTLFRLLRIGTLGFVQNKHTFKHGNLRLEFGVTA